MRLKKIDIALPEIRKFFKSSARVFSLQELRGLLYGGKWDLPVKMTTEKFISTLKEKRILREVKLDFTPKVTCFTTQEANIYDVAINLAKNMYFSHYTAVHLHQLTEQIPKTIYVSKEFTPNGGYNISSDEGRDELTQEAVDSAMQKEPRVTKKRAKFKKQEIVFLNSKYTGDSGISEINFNDTYYRVTSLERTLLDVAMRPYYCGGISEVMSCFSAAHNKININKIIRLLVELDYIYPYHQLLGFYFSRTGLYSGGTLDRLKRLGLDYDFYLCHGFKKKDLSYDNEWKLFYPDWLI